NQVAFLGEKHDLALGIRHPLVERWMSPKPAHAVDIAFLRRDLVKELSEAIRTVTAVPGILNSQLVSFALIVATDPEQLQVQHETQAVEPVLQRVIGSDPRYPSGQHKSSDLSRLVNDRGDRSFLHQSLAVTRDHVGHLMRDHTG